MDNTKLAELALQRINHIEDILASSLFSLIITTTLAMFGSAYALRSAKEREAGAQTLIIGANVLYGVLSCYYYFMLTHFYAATAVAYSALKSVMDLAAISSAWSFFQVGGPLWWMDERTSNLVGLSIAPLFPVSISCFTITGLWFYLRRRTKGQGLVVLCASVLFHVGLFTVMILKPFQLFLHAVLP